MQQLFEGQQVQLFTSMISMVAKCPTRHDGWSEGPLPASAFHYEITKHVPEPAISELQPRSDQSCTFLLHSQYKEQMLRASGKNGFFIKQRQDANFKEMEVLYGSPKGHPYLVLLKLLICTNLFLVL